MSSPLVSVIITAYNRQKYIREAIESALNSSFDDYEIIIVDDGSTDQSFTIINEYSSNKKIRIYRNNKNLGQFENRNYAASLASGKYIKYLDSDDIIYKESLKIMVEAMQKNDDVAMAISYNKFDDYRPYPLAMLPEEAYSAAFLKGGFPFSGPSAAIIKTEIFKLIGGFQKPYYVGSDSMLWLKIAGQYPILKLQPSLIWYRQHKDQAFNIGLNNNEYLEKDYEWCLQLLNDADCPLKINDKYLAIKNLKKRFLRNLVLLSIKKHKPLIAYNIFKRSKMQINDLPKIF